MSGKSATVIYDKVKGQFVLKADGKVKAGFDQPHIEIYFFDQYRDRKWEVRLGKATSWDGG